MGLLTDVLLLPITGPGRGLVFILRQIQAAVDAEQGVKDRLEDEVMLLSLRYELDDLPEAEYLAEEETILRQLDIMHNPESGFAPELEGDTDDEHTSIDTGDPGVTSGK